MNNKYLQYNNIYIIDNPNQEIFPINTESECLNICDNDPNCRGVNIENPLCEDTQTTQECLNSIGSYGIVNNPDDLKKYNCKIISQLNNTNFITNSSVTNSFVNKENVDYSNKLSNQLYYLKNNNKYISVQNILGNQTLTWTNNIGSASKFKFNNFGNIIENNSNKCVQVNGNFLNLNSCVQDNNSQIFVFDTKLNNIRPINNINGDNILCLDLSYNTDNNKIILEKCSFNVSSEYNNQYIQQINANTKENFKSNDEIQIDNIDYCSNSYYKMIITIILIGILIYFIWFVSRKKYFDNDVTDNSSSIIK
jgi:hypothetical protein